MATPDGVFKVASVMRKPEDARWSKELIMGMKGSPKEPIPGSGSTRIVAYSKHREDKEKTQPEFQPRQIGEDPEIRKTYIYDTCAWTPNSVVYTS